MSRGASKFGEHLIVDCDGRSIAHDMGHRHGAGWYFHRHGYTLKTMPTVAKNPRVMVANGFTEATFTLNADSLVISPIRDDEGTIANSATIRLTRAK